MHARKLNHGAAMVKLTPTYRVKIGNGLKSFLIKNTYHVNIFMKRKDIHQYNEIYNAGLPLGLATVQNGTQLVKMTTKLPKNYLCG
jgi:hypothetical protein